MVWHNMPMTVSEKINLNILHDRPAFVQLCIDWDNEVWPRTPEIDDFFSEHYTQAATHTNGQVPQAWVLTADEKPIGMVSIINDDHPDFTHFTPWLASMYIIPSYRGRGFFKLMHDAAVAYAKTYKPSAALYVHSHIDFTRYGWHPVQDVTDPFSPGKKVTIYRYDLD